jgi:hemoglobin
MSEEQLPYNLIGGAAAITQLARRFYEVMAERPDAAGIRAMHADDLSRVTASLAGFLTGWMGGPRDWFMREDRPCIMSLHRALPIGEAERDQWLACMKQALEEQVPGAALREEIMAALFRTANAMRSQ